MSYFNNNLRSYSDRKSGPLSDDDLRALAPSIFATEAHESRSSRYSYIPTAQIIEGMRKHGFMPVDAKQGRSRIPGKADFTKHMIRFRHVDQQFNLLRVNDVFPEVALVNSHDGTSAYQVMSAMLRKACENGLIVAQRAGTCITVRHKGDTEGLVIEGSFTVLEESKRALRGADEWAGVVLSRDERMALAEAAHVARFGDAEGETVTPIRAEQLLSVRRREDAGTDLWTTTNVLQENVIRGGLTAWGRDANNRRRRVTTRAVNGIDQDVKLNRALWVLGERMAQLKAAA